MNKTTAYIQTSLKGIYPPEEIRNLARWIFESVCGWSLTQQILRKDTQISANQKAQIRRIVERLEKMEPIQYILGETEFYSLPIHVNPSVLIPRPETEELVDLIIKHTQFYTKEWHILDIGTGSGCIAIALKTNIPNAEISALDVSEKALFTAKENARLNNAEINFIQADILDITETEAIGFDRYDIIVSNPPYVKDCEKSEMKDNILKYEPHLALFVPDNDALRFYKAISDFAKKRLVSGGRLYFEINASCSTDLKQLLLKKGFQQTEVLQDLSHKDRFIQCINP